jgi:Xaa-Pro aminopeptidase
VIGLERVGVPELLVPEEQPLVPVEEYERRLDALRARVDADAVVVYADREHVANVAFLCGFDPRFEEALLVLAEGRTVLLVGTESQALASLVGVDLEVLHCPSLGLMGQDRSPGLTVRDALAAAGVRESTRVGLVGWKYFEPGEGLGFAAASFVVDALRDSAGELVDATETLMNPRDGLRSTSTADQIAAFEWAAARASRAVFSVLAAAEPGATERQVVGEMGFAGEPLSAHVMFSSGPEVSVGLRSPTDRVLAAGDPVTVAVGYWGGLCCRAGLLDAEGVEYLERMAVPYWRAIVTWYESVRLGVPGDEIDRRVRESLEGTGFGSALNPGHLVHLDEWVHTPVRPGSVDPIRSGMCMQCDIIPAGAREGWAANCEDTVAVADAELRAELAARHPELWSRIAARQDFMRRRLGIALADEVLPLSAAPAYFAPFWLEPDLALVLS